MTVRKSRASARKAPPARKKAPVRKPVRQGANRRRRAVQKRVLRQEQMRSWGQNLARRFFHAAAWLLLACAAGAGAWQGWRAYRAGRFLVVRQVDVEGNRRWDDARILAASGVAVGEHLFALSSGKIRQSVLQLPGIQDVAVHVGWDGDVRLDVREADIVALRRTAGWQGFTAAGQWIPLRRAVADVPVVEERPGVDDRDRVALAAFLEGARAGYPGLFAAFSQLDVKNGDEADIYWRDGRLKVRVDYANKSLNSLEFLRALLARERASWPRQCTVDLRVEGYAYVL